MTEFLQWLFVVLNRIYVSTSFFSVALVTITCSVLYKIITSRPLSDQQMKERLNNKVAIVTGSARGLGRAIAESLLQFGASVVFVDVLQEELAKTEKEIRMKFPRAKILMIVGDLTKDEARQKVVDDTKARFGKLDLLFSNHGIMPSGSIFDSPIGLIDKVLDVNFKSHVLLTKLALPLIRETKGSIVVTSSMAGTDQTSN